MLDFAHGAEAEAEKPCLQGVILWRFGRFGEIVHDQRIDRAIAFAEPGLAHKPVAVIAVGGQCFNGLAAIFTKGHDIAHLRLPSLAME